MITGKKAFLRPYDISLVYIQGFTQFNVRIIHLLNTLCFRLRKVIIIDGSTFSLIGYRGSM